MSERLDAEVLDAAKGITRNWWLYLVAGFAWFILGFLILTWNLATVWAVAVFAGIVFIVGGVFEFFVAAVAPGWKWVHVVFGLVSIAAGVVAIAWPGQTFAVLAAILAWYLLFAGVFEVIIGFMVRRESEVWWIHLLLGVAQILIGAWAVGYEGRAEALLVIWIAALAIARGLSDMVVAFGLHHTDKDIDEVRSSLR